MPGDHHVVVHQPPSEPAADACHVDGQRIGGNPAEFCRIRAAARRRLARRPDLQLTVLKQCRAILWLQRGVREEGIIVVGLDHFGRLGQRCISIACLEQTRLRSGCDQRSGISFILRSRKAGNSGVVPLHHKLFAGFARLPPAVGDDQHGVRLALGHEAAVHGDDRKHAGNCLDRSVIHGGNRSAMRGALDHGCMDHTRKPRVDAEQRLTLDDLWNVHALLRLADDRECRGILERNLGQIRSRLGRCRLCERCVGQAFAAGLVQDGTPRGRKCGGIDTPLLRRCYYQHRACRCANLPHRQPIARGRGASPRHLRAEALFIGVGLLDPHLFPRKVEFLGDQHR